MGVTGASFYIPLEAVCGWVVRIPYDLSQVGCFGAVQKTQVESLTDASGGPRRAYIMWLSDIFNFVFAKPAFERFGIRWFGEWSIHLKSTLCPKHWRVQSSNLDDTTRTWDGWATSVPGQTHFPISYNL